MSVSLMCISYLMHVQIISSSVMVAEWPFFGGGAALLVPYVLFVSFIFAMLVIYHLGFEDISFVLFVPVPDTSLIFHIIILYTGANRKSRRDTFQIDGPFGTHTLIKNLF